MLPRARPPETLPRRYGKYELLERIGEGGMAEVYRARLPGAAGFEKILVIKRILPHLAESPRFVRMFVNEAKLAAQIQHQNVVQVFELGESEDGELYMAMEHVHGLDLRALLEQAAERVVRIPVWFTVQALSQVLGGLVFAHELLTPEGEPMAVIHRDVTPSNVFVSFLGEVKLADFGVAKAVGAAMPPSAEITLSGQLKGKIAYAPPEQIHGEPLDARADLFSVGVVLWECLTQQRLFGGRADYDTMLAICEGPRVPPSARNPAVPPELDAIVLQALEADRERRWSSARELQAALQGVLARIRPRLMPSDMRHVMEVLTGKKPAHPVMGAELPSLVPPPMASPPSVFSVPAPPRTQPPPRSDAAATLSEVLDEELENEPVLLTQKRAPSITPTYQDGDTDLAMLAMTAYDDQPEEEPLDDLRAQTPPPLDIEGRRPPIMPAAPMSRAPSRPPMPSSEPPPLRPSADDLPRWEPEAADAGSGPHFGAHAFYARTRDGLTRGPLEFSQFMRLLNAKSVPVMEVSADDVSWMPMETFVSLMGMEALSDGRPRLKNVTAVGALEDSSVVAVFAKLAKAEATGRLVLMAGSGASTRREIEVLRGAPIYVWTDRPDLQAPALAVRREVITRDRIPELLHECLRTGQPFEEALRAMTSGRGRHRAIFMRDRLVEAMRWRQGKYAFDASPVEGPPFSPSLLSGLVDHALRAWNEAELSARLGDRVHARLEQGDDLERVAPLLELGKIHEAILDRLGSGKTVAQVAKKAGLAPSMAVAWVAIECGALQIKN